MSFAPTWLIKTAIIGMLRIKFFLSVIGITMVPITTETGRPVTRDTTSDEGSSMEKLSDERMLVFDSSQDTDYAYEASTDILAST